MTLPLTFPPRPSLPLDGGSWSDVPGARCGVAKGRIKLRADRDDVVVLYTPGGSVAGVTTLSTAAAAPCRWTRDRLPGRASAVVINSGNANAATGRQGEADTLATAQAVAEALGVEADEVLVCSTGVIGQPMPMDGTSSPPLRQPVVGVEPVVPRPTPGAIQGLPRRVALGHVQ